MIKTAPTTMGTMINASNAGYLAARLMGDGPSVAAAAAHRLAGQVIRHRGAIMPRAAAAMH